MNTVPLRLSVAAGLLLAPAWLSAQVAPSEKPAPADTSKPAEAVQLESMEVTGSRIRTLVGEQSVLPTLSISQVELERRGINRLADIRWAIPQLGGSVGFNDNLGNGGPSRAQQTGTSFNLRGLGGNSTLVLVNGRRIPHTGQEAPGGAGGREDFSVDGIPISAIERIDVLPQGAGAVYGAEAIAGVINIVLKKNYRGADLNVSYDNAFKSDVAQKTISLTAGYSRGKLSTFLTASFEDQNALASRDRWFTAKVAFPEFGGSTTFLLSQPPEGAGSLASTGFQQNPGQANLPGLPTNVVAIPAGYRGTGATVADYAAATLGPPYDQANYSTLIDEARRRSVVFTANYDHATWVQPYIEARWSESENFFTGTPVTMTFTQLPVGYPGNPFSTPVFLRKVFYDLPSPQMNSSQENLGVVAGVQGAFLENWRYDASASWARNIVADDQVTAGFNGTLLAAALANPDPARRPVLTYDSSRPGLDPNPPGLLQSLMPAFDHEDTTDVYQHNVHADGSLWSGWAGDIRAAIGAEAQTEEVNFWRQPGDPSLAFTLTKPFSRDVTAAFAEVSVPLLSDRQGIPWVHRLELGGAVRAEDYSDIGSETTPRYSALLQPTKWITLRVSRAEGYKPPRLYDLLAPRFFSTTTLTATSRVFDTQRGGEPVLGTVNTVTGGNPTLQPEHSVSRNAGLVVDVVWIKGLSFSADYYELEYNDRSGGPSRQVLIDFFPDRVTREPTVNGVPGRITGLDTSNISLSRVKTKGWDYRLVYDRSFSFGALTLSASYSEPEAQLTKPTPASVFAPTQFQPRRGSASFFLRRGAWDGGVAVNYQDAFPPFAGATPYPSYLEVNPNLSYNFGKATWIAAKNPTWWSRALSGSKVSVTLINALNRDPEPADVAASRIIMDPRLRRYIVSLGKRF